VLRLSPRLGALSLALAWRRRSASPCSLCRFRQRLRPSPKLAGVGGARAFCDPGSRWAPLVLRGADGNAHRRRADRAASGTRPTGRGARRVLVYGAVCASACDTADRALARLRCAWSGRRFGRSRRALAGGPRVPRAPDEQHRRWHPAPVRRARASVTLSAAAIGTLARSACRCVFAAVVVTAGSRPLQGCGVRPIVDACQRGRVWNGILKYFKVTFPYLRRAQGTDAR